LRKQPSTELGEADQMMAMGREDPATEILLEILAMFRPVVTHMGIQPMPIHDLALVEVTAQRGREMGGRTGVLLKGRTATTQIAV
jgi:hypothetical protein